jgi:hypothetical protein
MKWLLAYLRVGDFVEQDAFAARFKRSSDVLENDSTLLFAKLHSGSGFLRRWSEPSWPAVSVGIEDDDATRLMGISVGFRDSWVRSNHSGLASPSSAGIHSRMPAGAAR